MFSFDNIYIPAQVKDNMVSIAEKLLEDGVLDEDTLIISFTDSVSSQSISTMHVKPNELIGACAHLIGASTVGILFPDGVVQVVSWSGGNVAFYLCQEGQDVEARRLPIDMISRAMSSYPAAYALKKMFADRPIEEIRELAMSVALYAQAGILAPEHAVPAITWAVMERPQHEVMEFLSWMSEIDYPFPTTEEIYDITGVLGGNL